MHATIPTLFGFILLFSLGNNKGCTSRLQTPTRSLLHQEGKTLSTRFSLPAGFQRIHQAPQSFGHFLRNLPLEKHGTPVLLYDGQLKENQDVHEAVLKIDVGKRDLQQCADAVMRLRAEYLFQTKQYAKIHFHFTNGFDARYSKWAEGYRIKVSGNKVSWLKTDKPDYSYHTFRAYLDIVFSFAGTLSLSKELKTVKPDSVTPGDVFIKGGSPGHAVIVMDVIENPVTKKRMFMLAQSYMPAQQIHIIKNPISSNNSPWYSLKPESKLYTPEWTFDANSLKRFYE